MSEHEHHHHGHGSIDSPEKLKALLHHMYHHNEEHTEELHAIVHALEDQGSPDLAAKVSQAIDEYTKGNKLLDEALKELP